MFILARDLGMTVARLRRAMSTAELTEWIGFYQYEAREREAAKNRAAIQNRARRRR